MKKYFLSNNLIFIITILTKIIATVMWVYFAKIMEITINTTITNNFKEFYKFIIITISYIVIVRMLDFIANFFVSIFINKIIRDIRNDYFQSIYHDNKIKNSGEAISTLNNDMNIIKNHYLYNIIIFIVNIVSFIISSILLFQISLQVSLIVYFLIILIFIIPVLFKKKLMINHDRYSRDIQIYTTKTKDYLNGFETIQNYNIKNDVISDYKASNKILQGSSVVLEVYNYLVGSISHLFTTLLGSIGFLYGSYLVMIGQYEYGTMIAIVQLTNTLASPINQIMMNIGKLIGSKKVVNNVIEKINFNNRDNKIKLAYINDFKFLEFKNVSFVMQNKQILDKINFKIEKGNKYAIIGETGSGKSTILKLIMQYYENYDGEILLNDVDLKNIKKECIFNIFRIINQDIYIFTKTIKENIILFREFEQSEYIDACNYSQSSEFINLLENQDQTILYENGNSLSGGEKQRIAIARLLLKNTPVCLLDEATSALDNETSNKIENVFLSSNITLIMVTHKLNKNILSRFNEILVIKDGKILERGNFESLVNRNSYFQKLYDVSE